MLAPFDFMKLGEELFLSAALFDNCNGTGNGVTAALVLAGTNLNGCILFAYCPVVVVTGRSFGNGCLFNGCIANGAVLTACGSCLCAGCGNVSRVNYLALAVDHVVKLGNSNCGLDELKTHNASLSLGSTVGVTGSFSCGDGLKSVSEERLLSLSNGEFAAIHTLDAGGHTVLSAGGVGLGVLVKVVVSTNVSVCIVIVVAGVSVASLAGCQKKNGHHEY